MFVNQTKVGVRTGKGGDGAVAFSHERYVPLGDPAGGDGGRGGNTILVADPGSRTLTNFRPRRKFKVDNGESGRIKPQYGRGTKDVHLKVPMETSVYDSNTGELLGDLVKNGQELIVAHGGKGGRGNIHFATPTRIAPEITGSGEPGELRTLRLELKVLADVGLVGFPSIEESTLLSIVVKAEPKVAAYEFTTLTPNLGMVVLPDGRDFSAADSPGLVEDTSKGVGPGTQFLRYVGRIKVILHLVLTDSNNGRDAYEDCETIHKELADYTKNLTSKKELIVATQMDIPSGKEKLVEFKEKLGDKTVYPIFSVTHQGVSELVDKTADLVEEVAREEAKKPAGIKVAKKEYVYKKLENDGLKVERTGEHSFVVTDNKSERLVQRTNLDHTDGIMLLTRKLKRMDVDDTLREKRTVNNDDVPIADFTSKSVD